MMWNNSWKKIDLIYRKKHKTNNSEKKTTTTGLHVPGLEYQQKQTSFEIRATSSWSVAFHLVLLLFMDFNSVSAKLTKVLHMV